MYAIRAPDHLGDGVMALPAIRAIAELGKTRVYAPVWGPDLYEGLAVFPKDEPPKGEVGVLLKPSFGAAWRWHHLPQRVGLATDRRGPLLSQALPLREEHRRLGYARVAGSLGARVTGLPTYTRRGTAPPLPERFVALNPWSPSPSVRWPHFRRLADALVVAGVTPVFFGGPGEAAPVAAIAGPHRSVIGLPLPDFAAALDGCAAFVSNDSGAAHFAAACGARVLMLHGSTTAERTGVGMGIEGPDLWCRPCYRKRCFRASKCLVHLGADRVVAATLSAIAPSPSA